MKQASSSWFGRWWGGSGSSSGSGPVKANLGEESAFYYDKEKKRWVNKNVRAIHLLMLSMKLNTIM